MPVSYCLDDALIMEAVAQQGGYEEVERLQLWEAVASALKLKKAQVPLMKRRYEDMLRVTAEEQEGWIRKNSLLVLIFEGIVAGVFDYDYAPVSAMVGTKRVWLNISQEGKDDIDDVRQGGLINGLKLSSEDLQP